LHEESEEALAKDGELTRVAAGASVSFIGKVAGAGVRYVTQVATALFLGADRFGVFTLGLVIYQFGELFSMMGLVGGVTRYAAMHRGLHDERGLVGVLRIAVGFPFIGGVVVGLFVFFLSDIIALRVFGQPSLSSVLRLLAIALPFGASMLVAAFATTGFQVAKYVVYVRDLIHPATNFALVLVLCGLGLGLVGASIAWVLSAAIGLFAALHFLQRLCPAFACGDISPTYQARKMIGFSLPLALGEMTWLLLLWTDLLMLGSFRSASEVGVYRAVSQTALFVPIFLGSLNTIFAPMIADLYNRGDTSMMGNLFRASTRWSLLLSMPFFILLLVAGKELLRVFGPEFPVGTVALVVLAVGHLINAGTGGVGYMLAMSGHQYVKLLGDVVSAALNVALNALLIPRWGILGAAVATGLSIAMLNLVYAAQVYRLLGVQAYDWRYLKIALASAVAAVAGIFARLVIGEVHFVLLLLGTGGVVGVAYVTVLWLAGFEDVDRMVAVRLGGRLWTRWCPSP
jgi:O-antigen/teichoic acid export membrane protein